MYDLIIIGAGPAGMAAGVYAARKELKTLILTQDIGGQAAWSSDVENYLGFSMISGAALVEKFEHHVEQFKDTLELRLVTKGVDEIKKIQGGFSVHTHGYHAEHAKSVIIAGGKLPRPLGVPGEKEFLNRGVTYCAWCDGPLFRGKNVAIVGGGNAALDAALNVSGMVKSLVIVNITSQLTADQIMIDKIKEHVNVRILNDTEVVKINGTKLVESITIQQHHEKKTSELQVEGVFVEVGSLPATNYLKGFVRLNKAGEIVIGNDNTTSQAGVFAAGDITDIPEKQIITAAGEGAKAAIQVAKYLARLS